MSADDGVAPGTSAPLGATVSARGVNFSVFAKRSSRVELLLFDSEQAAAPSCIIALDPITHRTYHCRQHSSPASPVVNTGDYDWEGDQPIHRSFVDTVVCELHVRGVTRHPSRGQRVDPWHVPRPHREDSLSVRSWRPGPCRSSRRTTRTPLSACPD